MTSSPEIRDALELVDAAALFLEERARVVRVARRIVAGTGIDVARLDDEDAITHAGEIAFARLRDSGGPEALEKLMAHRAGAPRVSS